MAFKVKKEDIENCVKVINQHPGVSHNYERDHEFNIWFTVATPPNSKLGLEKTIKHIKENAKALEAITLPTIKMFKIAVKLDTTNQKSKKEKIKKREYKNIELGAKHYAIIKEVQKDIKIVREPFAEIVDKLNIDYRNYSQ